MKSFTAGPNENGVRLSRFVEGVTKDMPRSMMYKAFRNKRIKVNGKRAEPDTRLSAGDLIELYINDEFFPVGKPTAKTAKLPRRQPPVTVVYEDENFAVLYKPAHLLCHSDRTGDANLVDAFAAYLEAKGEYDPHAEKRFAPALCNRLDRGTEGLVLAAKSYAALRDLNAIIRDDMMKKEYLTITVGAPPQGRFVAWLQHSEKNNKVRIHARESEGYKQIITEVTVIRQAGPFALCRIGLITGRTHQIRIHMKYLGFPLIGDYLYNPDMEHMTRQALHSHHMEFAHPITGEWMSFTAPLPADMANVLKD